MQKLMEIVGDFELTLSNLKVESMLNDLLENSARVEQYDEFTRNMAKARSAGFLVNYVQDLDMVYDHIAKYVEEQRKIARSSSQLAGTEDEKAIEGAPNTDGKEHICTDIVTQNDG